MLSEEFGLHPLAVKAALHHSQRPKLNRYRSHLFLTAYAARLDTGTGELATSEIAAFTTSQALITVRKDDGLDIDAVVQRWDESPDLALASTASSDAHGVVAHENGHLPPDPDRHAHPGRRQPSSVVLRKHDADNQVVTVIRVPRFYFGVLS